MSQGWSLIGDPNNKSLFANGSDQVYIRTVVQSGVEQLEALAVELKDTASVTLSTLGKSASGDNYGGSIARVVNSASRLEASSNAQLRVESRMILDAAKSGTLKNALFTSANSISKGAMNEFNYVYQTAKDGVVNTITEVSSNPVAQQAGGALSSITESLLSAPVILVPYRFIDPENWFGKRIEDPI